MADLSNIETAALASFKAERDFWKSWTWEMVRANPAIEESALRAALLAAPDPYPENAFGIKDRTALLDEYCTNLGSYAALVGLLMNYPIQILLRVCPELGMPLPSLADVVQTQICGLREWGYNGSVADISMVETRDSETNVVNGRILSGTVDGVLRQVRQDVDVNTGCGGPWRIEV